MKSLNRKTNRRRGINITPANLRHLFRLAQKLKKISGRKKPPKDIRRVKPAAVGKRPSDHSSNQQVVTSLTAPVLERPMLATIVEPRYGAKGKILINLNRPRRAVSNILPDLPKSYATLIASTFADERIDIYLSSARVALGLEQDVPVTRTIPRQGGIPYRQAIHPRITLPERFKYLDNIALALYFPSASHCHNEIKGILMKVATNTNPIRMPEQVAAVVQKRAKEKIRELIVMGVWGNDMGARALFRKGKA